MLKQITSNILLITSGLRNEIDKIFTQPQQPRKQKQVIVTEAMLQKFPAPVKRYLLYTGVVGKPIVQTVRLKQTGKIRKDAKQALDEF